jgi:hypothetical protein
LKAASTLGSLLVAYHCQSNPAPRGSGALATATLEAGASALRPAAAPTTAPPIPWFVGEFEGSYRVERHVVDRPSVQAAWVRDDGTRWSGAGTLSFECDPRGRIRGRASGALGAQALAGAIDEGGLSFRLQGEPGLGSASGTVTCPEPQAGREISCTLQASSADGNFVRTGSAQLVKVVTSPK